ncbi:MAG TPA: hypothetical protein EYH06_08765 [Chromatiales bacterium]|nr:hypothetical protein [Thiotrichales bacterium]HIP68666.1 hypothetical protein [Chromatiales bacterium]
MTEQQPSPGVSRENRISDDGLQRLEKHLAAGTKISRPVLAQWIRRYGEPAREIIKRHGRYSAELEGSK